jgi:hypothetical protein
MNMDIKDIINRMDEDLINREVERRLSKIRLVHDSVPFNGTFRNGFNEKEQKEMHQRLTKLLDLRLKEGNYKPNDNEELMDMLDNPAPEKTYQ